MEHTSNPKKNTIADILQKIQNKEISVHSKTFFRLRFFIFAFLLIAICIISVLLCSFVLFTIHMSGQPYFVQFGMKGILLLFLLFPWVLFLLDVVLIGILGMLMRHVSFGYRVPGIYIVALIGIIIGICGYVVESQTSFHRSMLDRADRKQLPMFGDAYTRIRRAPPEGYGIYRGTVMFREGDFLRVDIDDAAGIGTTTTVVVRIVNDPSASQIEPGDSVFMSGKVMGDTIIDAQLRHAPRLPRPY